ncbi:hypothetical protein HDU81_002362 [Chytriomyces hyalinus]|nr:hypothetical protein HDU81_002362 [Chytriomyces hyalinus]
MEVPSPDFLNSTSQYEAPYQIDDAVVAANMVMLKLCLSMTVICALGTGVALMVMIRLDVDRERGRGLRAMLTPFNSALLTMGTSLVFICGIETMIFKIISVEGDSGGPQAAVLYSIQSGFIAIFESAYIYYNWKRVKSICKLYFPSFTFALGMFALVTALGSYVITLLLALHIFVPANDALYYATGTAAIITLVLLSALDLCLLYVFIYCSRMTISQDGEKINPRFRIISNYGIASCLSLIFATGIYAVYVAIYIEGLLVGLLSGFMLSFFILLAMKIALHRHKLDEARQDSRDSEKRTPQHTALDVLVAGVAQVQQSNPVNTRRIAALLAHILAEIPSLAASQRVRDANTLSVLSHLKEANTDSETRENIDKAIVSLTSVTEHPHGNIPGTFQMAPPHPLPTVMGNRTRVPSHSPIPSPRPNYRQNSNHRFEAARIHTRSVSPTKLPAAMYTPIKTKIPASTNGIQTYAFIHLSPIDEEAVADFMLFIQQPAVDNEIEQKLFHILLTDFGAEIFLQKSQLFRMILNGLETSSPPRISQSLAYISRLSSQWITSFRTFMDGPMSVSSKTPISATPNMSLAEGIGGGFSVGRGLNGRGGPVDSSRDGDFVSGYFEALGLGAGIGFRESGVRVGGLGSRGNEGGRTSVQDSASLDLMGAISIPYACHEIWFLLSRLMAEGIIGLQALQVLDTVTGMVLLYLDSIVRLGNVERSLMENPVSADFQRANDSQAVGYCMDYLLAVIPCLSAIERDSGLSDLEASAWKEKVVQFLARVVREFTVLLEGDNSTQVQWHLARSLLNAPSSIYSATNLMQSLIPALSSDSFRRAAFRELLRFTTNAPNSLPDWFCENSIFAYCAVKAAANDDDFESQNLAKQFVTSSWTRTCSSTWLEWVQLFSDEDNCHWMKELLSEGRISNVDPTIWMKGLYHRSESVRKFSFSQLKLSFPVYDNPQYTADSLVFTQSVLSLHSIENDFAYRDSRVQIDFSELVRQLESSHQSNEEAVVASLERLSTSIYDIFHSNENIRFEFSKLLFAILFNHFNYVKPEFSPPLGIMDSGAIYLFESVTQKYFVYTSSEIMSTLPLENLPVPKDVSAALGLFYYDYGNLKRDTSVVKYRSALIEDMKASKSHDEFEAAFDGIFKVILFDTDLSQIDARDLSAHLSRFLNVHPATPDDEQLLIAIVRQISNAIWKSDTFFQHVKTVVLKCLSTLAFPTILSATAIKQTGIDYQNLASEFILLLKRILGRSSLMELAECVKLGWALEVLINYTYHVFSLECENSKSHADRIHCLQCLAVFGEYEDFVQEIPGPVATSFVQLLVSLLGLSQQNYINSTDGNAFTYQDRSVYRLVVLSLRSISRCFVVLQDSFINWLWGDHWLFEGDIEWLLVLLNDDERIIQKYGLGILGNLILIKDSYPLLCVKIPQFLDMAFLFVLDFERNYMLRKEAVLIINNFLITYCHDNKISSVALLSQSDESLADISAVSKNADGDSSVATQSQEKDSKISELLDIFDHCGFFELLGDLIRGCDEFAIIYMDALTGLLLNLMILASKPMFSKLSNANAWEPLLAYLSASFPPMVDEDRLDESKLPLNIRCRKTQFLACYQVYIKSMQNNVLNIVLLAVTSREAALQHFVESTTLLEVLQRVVMRTPGDRTLADQKCLNTTLEILTAVVQSISSLPSLNLDRWLKCNNTGGKVLKLCESRIVDAGSKKNRSSDEAELIFQKAWSRLVAQLLAIHTSGSHNLALDDYLKSSSGVSEENLCLGEVCMRHLMDMIPVALETNDAPFIDSLCICLQILVAQFPPGKLFALSNNVITKWSDSTRIIMRPVRVSVVA